MSPSGAELLNQIKSRISEVEPAQVREQMTNGAVLVDVLHPDRHRDLFCLMGMSVCRENAARRRIAPCPRARREASRSS